MMWHQFLLNSFSAQVAHILLRFKENLPSTGPMDSTTWSSQRRPSVTPSAQGKAKGKGEEDNNLRCWKSQVADFFWVGEVI